MNHHLAVADLRALTRDEWLEARRRGIGGSDAAAVLGWSPWTSPWELWLDKTGQLPDGMDESSEAMEWGTRLEAVIAGAYAERTGRTLSNPQMTYRHPDHEWMLASPDRLIADPDREGLGLLEIKNVTTWKAEEWEDGNVPIQYLVQWQHTAAVVGCTWGEFAALVGGNRLVTVPMERDGDFVTMLIDAETEFWDRVVQMRPPPIDGQESTEDLLKRLFDQSDPDRAVELDAEIAAEVLAYHDGHEQMKAGEEAKRQAGNRLRAALGEAEAGVLPDGTKVVTLKAGTRTRLNERALREEQPEIARKYETTSTSRTLRPARSKAALGALSTYLQGER